jgi:flagellar protein FlaG
MASVSVSHMILFIASMVIAASVAGVFTSNVDRLSEAIDDQGLQVSDNVRSDIEVISDSGSDNVYDDTNTDQVILHVKNIGTNDLIPNETHVDVLINGEFQPPGDITIEVLGDGDPDTWTENEVVKLTINQTLSAGDHRAKVIVNGDEEVFEFKV